MEPALVKLRERGYCAEVREVSYELQRGGTSMARGLVTTRLPGELEHG